MKLGTLFKTKHFGVTETCLGLMLRIVVVWGVNLGNPGLLCFSLPPCFSSLSLGTASPPRPPPPPQSDPAEAVEGAPG